MRSDGDLAMNKSDCFPGLQVVRRAYSDFRMVNTHQRGGSCVRRLTMSRDESFNSITGLNGSGKSNILDSICFVLGITNMSTVRAQNLQVSRQMATPPLHPADIAVVGSDLQARPGWRHQSQCHDRFRQQGYQEVADRFRRVCHD